MNIQVELHTLLQRQTTQGRVTRLELALPPESTLADILTILEVKLALDDLLLAVNGRMADVGQTLQDGDRVDLIPAISGGSQA